MIYGNPFYFALQFDVVESWNAQGNEWGMVYSQSMLTAPGSFR
ncbi:Imm42 family immunity protein [Pseudomonas sp. JS3066]